MINTIINKHRDCLILLARLIVGGIFIYSGWMKIADMSQTLDNFSKIGIPSFLTYIVAYGEVIGGALLVLGLWFEYATIFLSIIMIFAIWFTRTQGFGMFGLPLATLSGLLGMMAHGAGKYAVKLPSKIS